MVTPAQAGRGFAGFSLAWSGAVSDWGDGEEAFQFET